MPDQTASLKVLRIGVIPIMGPKNQPSDMGIKKPLFGRSQKGGETGRLVAAGNSACLGDLNRVTRRGARTWRKVRGVTSGCRGERNTRAGKTVCVVNDHTA